MAPLPPKQTAIILFTFILSASLFFIIQIDLEHIREAKALERKEADVLARMHGLSVSMSTSSLLSAQATRSQRRRTRQNHLEERAVAQTPTEITDLQARAPREKSKMTLNNYSRPSYDEIVSPENGTIIGDPQFLLDFVIAGFGKCGTSTMLHWLSDHPDVQSFPEEIWELMRSDPRGLIRMLYHELPPGPYIRGYKSPGEITQPHILNYFATYWPKTRLILGLRHPIRWFESLYNFRVQNLAEGQEMMGPNALIGRCHSKANHACTEKGAFAYYLMRLGKTNYNGTGWRKTTPLEEEIVGRFAKNWYNVSLVPYVPNPVFLFELRQLSDTNETRTSQLRKDIHSFVGLPKRAPLAKTIVHHKPGKLLNQTMQQLKDEKKINICHDTWKPVRRELLRMARQGSLWIRNVFLDSRDVQVSSRPYLEELLRTWMFDPCSNDTVTDSIIRFHGGHGLVQP